MRTSLAALVFATLCGGCVPRQAVIPDPSIPHRLSQEAEVRIYVRKPDGSYSEAQVRALKGWWIAAPEVVEGTP